MIQAGTQRDVWIYDNMPFTYRIAKIIFGLDFLAQNQTVWKKFEYKNTIKNKYDLFITCKTFYSVGYNILEYNLHDFSMCFQYQEEAMFVNKQWTNVGVAKGWSKSAFDVFTNQIFYTHAVQRHMIQIHSSMIDYRGKGLLFLGPSGIGKTTMAELWNQYRDALIINGDMNFVQDTGDEFIGWGTPWHGSSPYCENTSVPIQALIILRQALENYIRELSGFEKVQLVSNNIIYPTWLENGMELCLETLDHLLTKLPVYELSCRPDEDAVKLTEETIFGG